MSAALKTTPRDELPEVLPVLAEAPEVPEAPAQEQKQKYYIGDRGTLYFWFGCGFVISVLLLKDLVRALWLL